MYRWIYRCQFPNSVKQHDYRGKLAALGTMKGTTTVKDDTANRLKCACHELCAKAHGLKSVASADRTKKFRTGLIISQENQQLAQVIGQRMLDVLNDVKRSTVSVYSWLTRKVAQQIGFRLHLNKDFVSYEQDLRLSVLIQRITPCFWILSSALIWTESRTLSKKLWWFRFMSMAVCTTTGLTTNLRWLKW